MWSVSTLPRTGPPCPWQPTWRLSAVWWLSHTELIWLSVSLWRRIVRILIKIQFSTTQSLVCSLSENWSHCPGDQQQHYMINTIYTINLPNHKLSATFCHCSNPQQYSAILDLSRLSKMDTGSISLHSGSTAYKLMFIMLLVCHCSELCSKIDLDHNLLPRSRTKLAGRGLLVAPWALHRIYGMLELCQLESDKLSL